MGRSGGAVIFRAQLHVVPKLSERCRPKPDQGGGSCKTVYAYPLTSCLNHDKSFPTFRAYHGRTQGGACSRCRPTLRKRRCKISSVEYRGKFALQLCPVGGCWSTRRDSGGDQRGMPGRRFRLAREIGNARPIVRGARLRMLCGRAFRQLEASAAAQARHCEDSVSQTSPCLHRPPSPKPCLDTAHPPPRPHSRADDHLNRSFACEK